MTVYDYIELLSKTDKLSEKIEEFVEKNIDDEKADAACMVLEEAQSVICQYRGLAYTLTQKIEIENCIKGR